jgi:hypothetical protein
MTGQTDQYPEWRRQLVKSWAATMFTRERAADSLRIEVEFYRVPTIAEYRTGSRPSWEALYHADFQRRPLEAAERTDQ